MVKTIYLPKEALKNLFEPNSYSTSAHYDEANDILYIDSLNSDGAGSYEVLWIIEKKYSKLNHLLVVAKFSEPFSDSEKFCILEQKENLMINKTVKNVTEACADIQDGATIMLGGLVYAEF